MLRRVLRIAVTFSCLALCFSQLNTEYSFSSYMANTNKPQCDINIYFTIDTSKDTAGSIVDETKSFLRTFVMNLQEITERGSQIKWRYGALHFSDVVKPIISLTDQAPIFMTMVSKVSGTGRGTFVDCALKATTEAIQKETGASGGLKFAVVLTDGHITGNPCGGTFEASEAMRSSGIKTFVVATSLDTMESELRTIASYPAEIYWINHLANMNKDRNRTISKIIDIMVKEAGSECEETVCLARIGAPGPKGLKGFKGMKGNIGPPGNPGPPGAQGDLGIEGPIGFPGPKGYPGQKGEQGDYGEPGVKGDPGKLGYRGAPGEKGTPGRMGSTGCKGRIGLQGEEGPRGNVGLRGLPGYPGEKGFSGTQGRSGPLGSKGDAGDKGTPGYRGNVGLPGIKGLKGKVGRAGISGDQGIRGDNGLPGPRGNLGLKGQQGESGQEGQRGLPGEKGSNGRAGAPGFPGSRGPPGRGGVIGEKGGPGDPGDIGARGDIGLPGSTGDRGKPGNNYAGARGLPGSRGDPGLVGFPGSRGFFGEKGEQGPKGAKGDPVEYGPNGQQGERGPTGSPGFSGPPGDRGDPGRKECEIMNYVKEICGCCDCYRTCQSNDVVFVIDSSESVGKMNFSLAKNFVINIANRIGKMGKNASDLTGSRLGVVQYSHQGAIQAIRMDDPSIVSKAAFISKMKSMEWLAGGTWTPSALKYTYEKLIRPNERAVRKVTAFVITDGRYDPKDIGKLESLCTGVEVYAIGIGNIFNNSEEKKTLEKIACNVNNRVKILNFYAELATEEFLESVESVFCPEPNIICPNQICNQEVTLGPLVGRPVDIIFFVDGSERMGKENFVHVLRFIRRLAEELMLAENEEDLYGARIAIVQFGDENEQNVLLDFSDNITRMQSLPSKAVYYDSSSHIGTAILYAIKNIVKSQSGRQKEASRNAEVSFMFLTDGMNSKKNFAQAISSIRANNIVTSAIAVGHDINQERLLELTLKDNASIFRLKTFDQLFATPFLKNIVQWLA